MREMVSIITPKITKIKIALDDFPPYLITSMFVGLLGEPQGGIALIS
jgi:hypothetical protein